MHTNFINVFPIHTLIFQYHWKATGDKQDLHLWELKNWVKIGQHLRLLLSWGGFLLVSLFCYFQFLMPPFLLLISLHLGRIVTLLATSSWIFSRPDFIFCPRFPEGTQEYHCKTWEYHSLKKNKHCKFMYLLQCEEHKTVVTKKQLKRTL